MPKISRPEPDPIIAEHIEEISVPGVPWTSMSHITLMQLYKAYGSVMINELLSDYFRRLKEWNKELVNQRNSNDWDPW